MTLRVDRLAFGYPGHRVGKDVSFAVEAGEVLCLLGPNGCGKTTLFKTILRLLTPLSGSIHVDGSDLQRLSRRQVARALAYVPQQHDAYFPFTVLEVVLMGRSAHLGLFSAPTNSDREIALLALRSLHIDCLREAVYTELSGGERQLTLIARALAQESSILILDEPTANLDFGNQVLVLNSIRRLARTGITIIMSSHDPGHAFHVASRVALLKAGRLTDDGTPGNVITSDTLRDLYGVDVGIVELRDSSRNAIKLCVPKMD